MQHTIRFLAIAALTCLMLLGIQSTPFVRAESPPVLLVKQGKQHYDAGQFAAAIPVLQQAATAYATAGENLKQAQSLAFLSLAQQKLGQWQAAKAAIATGLQVLANQTGTESVRAQVLNAQGHLQLATGDAEAALATWQTAQTLYARVEDTAGSIGSQINQVQALQMLGFYRRAQQILNQLEQELVQLPDSGLKIAGLQTLGNLSRQIGELEQAERQLMAALGVARSLKLTEDEGRILIGLGNTEQALAGQLGDWENPTGAEQHIQAALRYYQQARAIAVTSLTRIQADLNQLSLQLETRSSAALPTTVTEIAAELERLPASRAAVDARVHFAHRLLPFSQEAAIAERVRAVLHTAERQAEQLQDPRATSYALGILGALYERGAVWSQAETTTRRALQIAQAINAADLSYQWQWQLGRLRQAQESQGNPRVVSPDAIAYYREALQTLNTLRGDLVALHPELQFSFREQVESVYREYVDLLLRTDQPPIANLIAARTTIEALQLAELDNFFRDTCARPQAVNIDDLDPTAAIVYPILLPDRLEVIVKLPGNNQLRHARQSGVSEAQVDQVATQLQRSLQRRSTSPSQIKRESRQLYDWLLKPFETDLAAVKTLVFVLDGSLRNIPPSVLFDGERYLVERYAIAVTPGLQLLDPKPLPQRGVLNVLVAGATDAPSFQQERLATLNSVAIELAGVERQVSRSQKLENQQFIRTNIQTQINAQSFNIVHIATHGQFSSTPKQTFILDWTGRIQVKDLDTLLRRGNPSDRPIELLILSACETATGDQRAALGLAGVAIRAGARSTLATLFQVNDVSTAELMVRFYQQLNDPTVTKAEALRRAQLSFLQDQENGVASELSRPYFWSPFILVGNWL